MKLFRKKDIEIQGIDEKLATASQHTIRHLVSELSEDELSLAWRSQLNDKLAERMPQVTKRAALRRWSRPVIGFAVTASVVGGIALSLVRDPASPGIEGSLVSAAAASTASAEVSGAGLAYHELDRPTRGEVEQEWTEYDLGVL